MSLRFSILAIMVPVFLVNPLHAGSPVGKDFWTNLVTPGLIVLLDNPSKKSVPPMASSHTTRNIEGWTVRIDDRLLAEPNLNLGKKALRVLEAKLMDIKEVVPEEKVKQLQKVKIVIELSCGNIGPMQYHPGVDWLKDHGYSPDLVKCVHIPQAAELPTRRCISDMPWVVLHELAHAYHDQFLGFDDPRVIKAYQNYKKSGRGEKALLYNGDRVRHYGLTDHKEFFAEMTESYFGSNDFYPFNRGEMKESEPEIYALMQEIWEGKK